jgi:ATP-dependent helicase YprA (DUF1998 family)
MAGMFGPKPYTLNPKTQARAARRPASAPSCRPPIPGETCRCASICLSQGSRAEIRERAQLLITNPDMLHLSVLPVHRTFSRLFAKLKHVVVDEGHAYRCGPGRMGG